MYLSRVSTIRKTDECESTCAPQDAPSSSNAGEKMAYENTPRDYKVVDESGCDLLSSKPFLTDGQRQRYLE
jgi:hypothetical protein